MTGAMVQRFSEDWKRYGLQPTLQAWTLRALKRSTGITFMEGIRLRQLPGEPSLPDEPSGDGAKGDDSSYRLGFLSRFELEQYAASNSHQLDSEFVRRSLARGDDCFGVFHGYDLAAYSWYSTQVTAAEDGFAVSCSKKYVYMYKAYTHPQYRGRRLYALGVTHAVREYLHLGFQGMICYVQPQNLASLKALQRAGCDTFGFAAYVRGTRWVHHSAGCSRVGFHVQKPDTRLLLPGLGMTTGFHKAR
jgi:hypothetical protein